MRFALMIEGHFDVSWDDWLGVAHACEEHGIETLFRCDHYTHDSGHGRDAAHDAWATLAGLAAVTSEVRLGTLVSPVTFRHPSVLARTVVTVDHISGGRVDLGLGAGWMELEHTSLGIPFPDTPTRLDLLDEQLGIIVRQWTEDAFDHHGEHYTLEDCRALPKPVQRPRPPVIVGGQAGPRSAAIAARWADEYNTLLAGPETVRERRDAVERAFADAGRDPSELTFSLMTTCVVGEDEVELRRRGDALATKLGREGEGGELLERMSGERLVGTVDTVVERLRSLSDAGVDRIMLQHLVHDDLEMVALIGDEVIPRLDGP